MGKARLVVTLCTVRPKTQVYLIWTRKLKSEYTDVITTYNTENTCNYKFNLSCVTMLSPGESY
jgi:hypothetical protein